MRILITDDDFQVRRALRLLIEQQLEVSEIDEALNVEQILEMGNVNAPDLILLDWELPHEGNYHMLKELKRHCPNAAVVVLSARLESRKEALHSGATAFIGKNDSPDIILSVITAIANHFPQLSLTP